MKYCTHCGKELCDEAVVCTNCGCAAGGPRHGGPCPDDHGPCPDEPFHGGPNGYGFPRRRPIDVMAIVGFVLSFFMPLAGLVVSIIAYNRAKFTDDFNSLGYAKAGIIISAIEIGLAVVLSVLLLIFFFGYGSLLLYGIVI
jgi:hypothetical protein